MDPIAELAAAEAELAAAEAELESAKTALAAAKALKPSRPTRPKAAKAKHRPIHHPESGLRAGIWGDSGPAPVGDHMRSDFTPVVTKHLDPTDRQARGNKEVNSYYVRVYNDVGQQQELAMTLSERQIDRMEADLPFGWKMTARQVKRTGR